MVFIHRPACILPRHWFEEQTRGTKKGVKPKQKEPKSPKNKYPIYKILKFPGGMNSSLIE